MPKVTRDSLQQLTLDIFAAVGVPEDEAGVIASHLVESDLRGHETHGVWRIRRYIADIKQGYTRWDDREILRETPALSVIDGRGANGIVALTHAASVAVEKARRTTFGSVAVRRLTHTGWLGDFAQRIAENDMIGVVMSNAGGVFVAPFGSADRRLGPNPLALAVPRRNGPPIVLDMSTSVVAGTRVRQAQERREPLPEGWLVDRQGDYVTDSQRYDDPDVALLPLGGLEFGHKGHGLSMMFEMIAGPLSHAGCTTGTGAVQGTGAGKEGGGFMVLAIAIESFIDLETYKTQVEDYVRWVNSARPLPGVERLYAPGEKSQEARERSLKEGVHVSDTTWAWLCDIARELGVTAPGLEGR